jgi:predicted DNA-binding ribbon-helix-helix protein
MKNNQNEAYKSARIKTETYKQLKLIAIERGMPLTQLIDFLLEEYLKKKDS